MKHAIDMIWPPERPLLPLPPEGTPLDDVTEDEWRSAIESKSRDFMARWYAHEIQAGRLDKGALWHELKKAPEAYNKDMVERLRRRLS
ncbi:MAG: hypothetical protein R6V05_09545 [Candidatus Brocadiia bacterium]